MHAVDDELHRDHTYIHTSIDTAFDIYICMH